MTKVNSEKAIKCPDEVVLSAYLSGRLKQEEGRAVEEHVSGCHFCLENIRTAYLGEKLYNGKKMPESSGEMIRKAKGLAKMDTGKKRLKGNLWLAAAIAAFTLSFTVPKYFAQFLVAALILGLKWVSESESIRTLIIAMDAKHRHSSDSEEEALKWRR